MRDDIKVSFVVPSYKCDEFIFRNIDSILDQDYRNYEIIVVLNGSWPTKADLTRQLADRYGTKIRLELLDEGNLPNANNHGFMLSSGDVISFLSSDLYLMPGALRTWVEALQDHPEAGFVYSGYRLVSPNPADVYFSEPFNLHHLRCENFIDGANPVRRQFVAPWNPSLKSLVDWDFFLSVCERGAIGHYIKEPLYHAEKPKAGGLSHDSSDNWKARWYAVRRAHNIPVCPVCITSSDHPEVALDLAESLGFDFRSNPGYKPHDYKLIYVYGFDPGNSEQGRGPDRLQMNCSIFLGHTGHKVIQWLGGDVRNFTRMRWVDVDYFAQLVLKRISTHWVTTDDQAQVLKRMGVDSELIYPAIRPVPKPIRPASKVVSINDASVGDQLRRALPDYEVRINDPTAWVSIHFQDDIRNILRSVVGGNHVITDIRVPGTTQIQGFTNVPELRKMLTHAVRRLEVAAANPDPKLSREYAAKTDLAHFRQRLLRLAEKPTPKHVRIQEMPQEAQA